MPVVFQTVVIISSGSKSLYPAILDSTAFVCSYRSHSDCINVAPVVMFPKCCRSRDGEIPQDYGDGEGERRWWGALFSGGRTCFLCLLQHKDAEDGDLRQNTMPRRLRAHPARQGEKKGRVTPGEGGGGGKLRIHRFALNQTKSKFLGVLVAMQASKWAGNLWGRDREDTHGHLHFKIIFSKYYIA